MRKIRCIGLLSGLLALTGCVSSTPPLYYWGHYESEVYSHFQAGKTSPEKEISVLEEDLQIAKSKGLNVPPGFHAHLGMLYAQLEKGDQAMLHFDAERTLYPESKQFMDFLTKNNVK